MGFLEQCTDDQRAKIYADFGATEETVHRDVQTLMEWLQKQPHLPNVKDETLIRIIFIRGKTSVERTKRLLETYYVFKAQVLSSLKNACRDPSTALFKKCYNLFSRFVLPKLLPNFNRILLITFGPPDDACKDISNDEFLCSTVTATLLLCCICGTHKGYTVIADCKNLSPFLVSLMLATQRRGMPLGRVLGRAEKIYLLNSSVIIEPVLMLYRQFSEKDMQYRFITWKKDEKDLKEEIPEECLPYEYGGTLGSRDELKESFFNEMMSRKSWLDEEYSHSADLDKLPKDRKRIVDMDVFGMQGSFRKLNLE